MNRSLAVWLAALLMLGLPACSGSEQAGESGLAEAGADSSQSTNDDYELLLKRALDPFRGDLPEIRDRRFLRVLVTHSRSNFFYDENLVARGFEADMLREYEKYLNQGKGTYDRVRLVFVPLPFDLLVSGLEKGGGEIAAAGLTDTAERRKQADFTDPYIPEVRELVVAHRSVEGLESIEDLAGREVMVRAGSSYESHLQQLNGRLSAAGKEPVDVVKADKSLATEDILEIVNSGRRSLTVADEHIAEAWAEMMPDLVVHRDLAVHTGGKIAWAVRKDAPELLASLNAFIRQHKKGTLLGNVFLKRYYTNSQWIKNPLAEAELRRILDLIDLFRRYGDQYGFEWQALAAQGFQESGLDQSVRSSSGAVGIMQLLPSTAADSSVGIPDISSVENNIHAGAKYMAFLRDRYFSDADMDPLDRVRFTWASYNAGPARVRRLRDTAAARGLDPNIWFGQVEQIAAREIGRETVDYVANITKYYLAYKRQWEEFMRRQAAREAAGLE